MKLAMGRLGSGCAVLAVLCLAQPAAGLAGEAAGDACPHGEGWVECRAAGGDRMALYRMGRTAYENARESGDFSEALQLSRRLVAAGDENGERLLKMVHMQLGRGVHKDYVQAYVWLSEDMPGDDDYVEKWRKMLAAKMTAEQLEQARSLTPK